jgi:antitoxin ParD1/3/4
MAPPSWGTAGPPLQGRSRVPGCHSRPVDARPKPLDIAFPIHDMSTFDIGPQLRYFPIMALNVSLTPQLDAFIHQTVSTGRYQFASEVVRTALRLLEEREQQKAATLEWLAQETQKGLDSGPAEPVAPAFWQGLRDKLSSSGASDNA